MLRTALRALIRTAIVLGVATSVATGCSRQAEGERCDFDWAGDQDCDGGLVCTPCGRLQDQSTSRCCLPGGSYTDSRCIPTSNPTGEICSTHTSTGTSTGGTGGTGAAGAAAASGAGGTSNSAGSGGTPSGAGATDVPTAGDTAAGTGG